MNDVSLTVEVQLHPEDYRLATRRACGSKGVRSLVFGVIAVVIPVVGWGRTDALGFVMTSLGAGLVAGLFVRGVMALVVVPRRSVRRAVQMDRRIFETPNRFELDDGGVKVIRPNSSAEWRWQAFSGW